MFDWVFEYMEDLEDSKKYYKLSLCDCAEPFAVEYQGIPYIYDLPFFPVQTYTLPEHIVMLSLGHPQRAVEEELCVVPQLWGLEIIQLHGLTDALRQACTVLQNYAKETTGVMECLSDHFDTDMSDVVQFKEQLDCRILSRDPGDENYQYSAYWEVKKVDNQIFLT